MKHLLLALTIIISAACGNINQDSEKSDSNSIDLTENLVSSCSVFRDEQGSEVVISCPDGTQEVIQDGKDGSSCKVEELVGGSMISCGETQAFIKNGENGVDGSACSVASDLNGSGSLISCSDGTSSFIRNGEDGVNGEDGAQGLDAITEVIDPCGSETTQGFDEVLLRLSSGDILAHLSSGENQHFVILKKERKYITTDGTKCQFEITADGEVKF